MEFKVMIWDGVKNRHLGVVLRGDKIYNRWCCIERVDTVLPARPVDSLPTWACLHIRRGFFALKTKTDSVVYVVINGELMLQAELLTSHLGRSPESSHKSRGSSPSRVTSYWDQCSSRVKSRVTGVSSRVTQSSKNLKFKYLYLLYT